MANPKEFTKIVLDESEMPTQWYNIIPDLPSPPPPPLHPATHQPVGPEDLAPLFPMGLILQEVSSERYIDIPPEVLDVYRTWRPSPLYRARRLEKALGTPARIYYKYEGVSPAGSHKPNTAVPQAYYNKEAGRTKITTETGAGRSRAPFNNSAPLGVPGGGGGAPVFSTISELSSSLTVRPGGRCMAVVWNVPLHHHRLLPAQWTAHGIFVYHSCDRKIPPPLAIPPRGGGSLHSFARQYLLRCFVFHHLSHTRSCIAFPLFQISHLCVFCDSLSLKAVFRVSCFFFRPKMFSPGDRVCSRTLGAHVLVTVVGP